MEDVPQDSAIQDRQYIPPTPNGIEVSAPTETNTPAITPAKQEETQQLQEIDAEVEEAEKEIQYRTTPKFNDWVRYRTEHNHYVTIKGEEKETYGNGTLSAMKAYNLNPETQYNTAKQLAWKNSIKVDHLSRKVLEDTGHTFEWFVALAVTKAKASDSPAWWDRLMKLQGYIDDKTTAQIVNNTQVNNFNGSINDPEVVDFNTKFLKFIESEPIE